MLSILEPVQEELALVESRLRQAAEDAFAPLARALGTLLISGGKRLRPALTILACKVFREAVPESVIAAGAALETLHTATLVHDDLIDGALLRRGRPTLNAALDPRGTVLAGDYIFAQAAAFAAETRDPRVISLFAETLKTICEGELIQILGRSDWGQAEEEYYNRIHRKTASLFAASAASGALLSGAPEEHVTALRDYGRHLGMAYQIIDDVLDFAGDEGVMGKPAGSDLRQGVLTLPVLYFAQQCPSRIQQLAELAKSSNGADELLRTVASIRESGAVDAAREEARRFSSEAKNNLRHVPAGPARQALHDLATFVVERQL